MSFGVFFNCKALGSLTLSFLLSCFLRKERTTSLAKGDPLTSFNQVGDLGRKVKSEEIFAEC